MNIKSKPIMFADLRKPKKREISKFWKVMLSVFTISLPSTIILSVMYLILCLTGVSNDTFWGCMVFAAILAAFALWMRILMFLDTLENNFRGPQGFGGYE